MALIARGGKVVLKTSKQELIDDLQKRVNDRILEPTNFELLKKAY